MHDGFAPTQGKAVGEWVKETLTEHEGTDNISANLTVGDSEQGESIALALLRKRVFTKSPVRETARGICAGAVG
jgi:hypothetical protein